MTDSSDGSSVRRCVHAEVIVAVHVDWFVFPADDSGVKVTDLGGVRHGEVGPIDGPDFGFGWFAHGIR